MVPRWQDSYVMPTNRVTAINVVVVLINFEPRMTLCVLPNQPRKYEWSAANKQIQPQFGKFSPERPNSAPEKMGERGVSLGFFGSARFCPGLSVLCFGAKW